MSVIYYDDKKFYRICRTLKLDGRELGHIWKYPEGWQESGGMDTHIDNFINDLRRGNIATWNRQYPDDVQPLRVLQFEQDTSALYNTDCELLKSLKGVHYNLISNDGDETDLLGSYKRLEDVIWYYMSKIIDRLPEYEKAETWC